MGRVTVMLASALAAVCLDTAVHSQQPTFRSVVDMIAVDVQVVDKDGNPIEQLAPGAFEVSIEGRRRKVISAQFVKYPVGVASIEQPLSSATPPVVATPADDSRTFIVAVDNGSFDVGTTREAIDAIRGFLDRVQADDRVGLYVYPTGGWISPTTQRAPLRVALDHVFGEKPPLQSYYNLRPFEIVDITAQPTNPNSFLTAATGRGATQPIGIAEQLDPILRIQRRECPGDAECPKRIYAEGMELGMQLQHQAESSLAGLQALLRGLADIPGRKSVVLVSAGLLVSDRLDGRPDVGDVARIMGQTAARARATVYTVHIDLASSRPDLAAKRGSASSSLSRDRAMLGNWLDDFSSAAGGQQIDVPVGGGEFAWERVLRECSAYYLLGVEPGDADRDGRPRQLHVKVDRRGVTVRSRQWVVVPAARKNGDSLP